MDSHAEKVNEYLLNWGFEVFSVFFNLECKKCLLYGVIGCLLFRVWLSFEVKERQLEFM